MLWLAAALAVQQPAWTSLTRQFDQYATGDSIVGASIMLVDRGRPVATHHFGFADRANGVRTDDRTIYHWASITKTLTAVGVMQLRDRGLLTLDDPVTRWVPEVRQLHNPFGSTDAVTIRMLLGHSSGFRNGTWPWGQGRSWEPFEPTRWEQLVAMMPYQEVLFAPDSRYGYSNPGFIYLARVMESLTGDAWQSYIYKNVWGPLGISGSYFAATPWHLTAHRSNNYTVRADSATRGERVIDNGRDFDPGITIPNGGWNAPLGDLAKWLGFLANSPGSERVLARGSLEELWRSRFPVSGYNAGADSMALSFFIYGSTGERLIGHTGDQAGFRSFFLLNPRTGRAVVAAFNTSNEARGSASDRGFREIQAAAMRVLRDR